MEGKMKDEYIIISKKAVQKELSRLKQQRNVEPDNYTQSYINGKIKQLEWVLSQSTPLIPEIEKAFTKGERYGWDSQKSIGNIDEMKEKIKLQSLDNYISNLKLDI